MALTDNMALIPMSCDRWELTTTHPDYKDAQFVPFEVVGTGCHPWNVILKGRNQEARQPGTCWHCR